MYRAMFEGHFTDHQWLTPCYTVDNALNPGAKRQVTLAGPHGLFSLGLNRTMHPEGCKMIMFVDNNLAVFNPFIRMFAKWTGMWDLEGLKHTKVTSALERGECDLIVVAGGFVEAAAGTQNANRIARQTWPYWVKQCLVHGYDLSFLWIYGATQVFDQSEESLENRVKLASHSIPAITPFGKFGLPIPRSPPLRVLNFKMELPHIQAPTPQQVGEWLHKLELRVQQMIADYPPPPGVGVAPIEPLIPWEGRSKL
eukprot:TRINITY_DN829_c0_g1_i12.p1 TRINITY_DN829_c0_g1~~TRINITY_DN829_c0_g1_i12.p1  ORF type:complete len:254 (-),score=64.08 TRINITY_DN829_c0_g1_i12:300-1061(-)